MVTLVATGVGGASMTPVPLELQTAKAGTKAISANWRAIRFDCGNRLGMVSNSSLQNGDSATETRFADARQQNAAAAPTVLRRIRWRLGWHGGETAIAPWLCATVFQRLCSEQRAHL
jgi:hypothetical protein